VIDIFLISLILLDCRLSFQFKIYLASISEAEILQVDYIPISVQKNGDRKNKKTDFFRTNFLIFLD